MENSETLEQLEKQFREEKSIFKKMEIHDKIQELKGNIIVCDFNNPDCENCSG